MAISPYSIKITQQGRELMEHGTAALPVGCYHDDLKREPVPWHWHDEMEVGIVTEGIACIEADTNGLNLYPGDGFFINSNILHALKSETGDDCRLHSIVFHPRFIGGGPESIFWQNYLQPLMEAPGARVYILRNPSGRNSGSVNDSVNASDKNPAPTAVSPPHTAAKATGSGNEVRQTAGSGNEVRQTADSGGDKYLLPAPWHTEALTAIERAWQFCANEPYGYEFEMRYALSGLICLLHRHLSSGRPRLSGQALRDNERIKLMLQYIQEHYTESLTTKAIAESALISENEALRCFRKTIGITPIKYVMQFRVREAAALLLSTDRKITDIGAACGFQDTSYFTKTFRELKNCTPGQYRKQQPQDDSYDSIGIVLTVPRDQGSALARFPLP